MIFDMRILKFVSLLERFRFNLEAPRQFGRSHRLGQVFEWWIGWALSHGTLECWFGLVRCHGISVWLGLGFGFDLAWCGFGLLLGFACYPLAKSGLGFWFGLWFEFWCSFCGLAPLVDPQ